MEKYFEDRGRKYYSGQKELEDFYPQYGYQTGATPEGIEIAREHSAQIKTYDQENKPVTPQPPPNDAKWRFFWHLNEPNPNRPLSASNPPRCLPKDFPDWETKMNRWGFLMHDATIAVSEMLAVGLGLPQDSFSSKMLKGPHLLAPTGSDLTKYDVGTIFAGFHYDLNFITIHGKSRFPGLYVWLRNGQKATVAVPDGGLLLQSGK